MVSFHCLCSLLMLPWLLFADGVDLSYTAQNLQSDLPNVNLSAKSAPYVTKTILLDRIVKSFQKCLTNKIRNKVTKNKCMAKI